MDLTQALLGGTAQADQYALNEARRQELKMAAMAKYSQGGPASTVRLWGGTPNAGAPELQPASLAVPTQQPREVGAAEAQVRREEGPPPLPVSAPAVGPIQAPPALDPAKYPAAAPPMVLPELPPAPAPEPGIPQLSIQQGALDQIRNFYRSEIRKPNGGSHVMAELLNLGLQPAEAQQLVGFGPLSPELQAKLGQQNQMTLQPMATGTETADQQEAAALSQRRAQFGERALSPMAEFGYPAAPPDMATGIREYGMGYDVNQTRRSTARGGTTKQFSDPVSLSLAKQGAQYVGAGQQVLNSQAYKDWNDRVRLRQALVSVWGEPDQEAQLQQLLQQDETLGKAAQKFPELLNFPSFAPMGGGTPAPAPRKPDAAEQAIRNQLSRIDPNMAADIRHALDVEGKTSADIMAIPAMRDALSRAEQASRKPKIK